ncbi:MAG TPA: hypothetical protein VIK59_07395 [Verrucomicrobiae bacterium]
MTEKQLQGIIQDGVPILADVIDIRFIASEGDCQNLLRQGATLLSVAAVPVPPDQFPFRFVLGWRRSAGEPSPLWAHWYDALDTY